MPINPPAPPQPKTRQLTRYVGRDLILYGSGLFSGALLTILGVLVGGIR